VTPPPRLLLALDMDGTLLRDDKSIAAEDAAAIRAAADQGIAVTLATGRLSSGALPTAQELGLSTPLVCADGGLLIDPRTGTALERRAIAAPHAALAVDALMSHNLVPFVFLADSIHCDEAGAQHRAIVEVWSRDLVIHPSLATATAWRQPDSVSLTVGLGARSAVERASQHLRERHADLLDTVHFGMNGLTLWAVRSLPHGCDKGDMLVRLAERMGLPLAQVAVVGDWYNDLGMFKRAGRSFAMGQAPDVVKTAATDLLRSTSATGGGIAEALAALQATRL
jgi:Cof subfamily protein (haloacid dehalogenase superfamily)